MVSPSSILPVGEGDGGRKEGRKARGGEERSVERESTPVNTHKTKNRMDGGNLKIEGATGSQRLCRNATSVKN